MEKFKEKYSTKKLSYINLDKLPIKIIKQKEDYKFFQSDKIRRNLPWMDQPRVMQSVLLDTNELCLLSRIHIYDAKIMRVDIKIAADIEGPFVQIEKDMIIVSGKIRIVKIGSLPCRYIKITVTRGSPIVDTSKIECFGLHINDIKAKYDENTLEILFYNSYDLIYRQKESDQVQQDQNDDNSG
jgi:hypothetical protein